MRNSPKDATAPDLGPERRPDAVTEIVARVRPWAGSKPQARAWYHDQPLPSFGGQTAEALVKQGRAEAVKAYLARIAAGGYT